MTSRIFFITVLVGIVFGSGYIFFKNHQHVSSVVEPQTTLATSSIASVAADSSENSSFQNISSPTAELNNEDAVLFVPSSEELLTLPASATTSILIKISNLLGHCSSDVPSSEKEIGSFVSSLYGLIALTPQCAYRISRQWSVDHYDIEFIFLGKAEPTTFAWLAPKYNRSYFRYGGKLYYGTMPLDAELASLKSPVGICEYSKDQLIADGVIWIHGKKTEIPESICEKAEFDKDNVAYSRHTSFILKEKTFAYLVSEYDGSLYIIQLGELSPSTLEQIGTSTDPWFFTDGNKVIRVDKDHGLDSPYPEPDVTVLPVRDPKTFKVLGESYSRDANTVYFFDSVVEGADPSSFQELGPTYGRDKNAVYYRGRVVQGADPVSFSIITDYAGGGESIAHAVARDGKSLWVKNMRAVELLPSVEIHPIPMLRWTDESISFYDDMFIYMFLDGELLKSLLPKELRISSSIKTYLGNIHCGDAPKWFLSTYEDERIEIAIPASQMLKYCEKNPRALR